jgi:membrane protein implicated in regulation of membrane protease activity
MFVLVAVVLLFALPHPWNVVGFAAGLACFAVEVVFWNRTVRGRKAAVGAQTLIGESATVVSRCRPDGQVRLSGEIWAARCEDGADPGDTVVVVARQGLTLVVEAAPE